MTYLLKSSACIAFVYIVYFAFFRQTNRFQLNRAYLLMGLVLSFVVPVIVMPAASMNIVTTMINEGYVTGSDLPVADVHTLEETDLSIIKYLYYSGVAISLLVTLRSVIRIITLYRSGDRRLENGQTIVRCKNIQPFSFMGILFIRSGDEDPMIIAHEMVHIRQRHWIDLMLAEAVSIVLWFNPFIHFYRRSIAMQHEYIADRHVTSNVPVQSYLACMAVQLESQVRSLVNNFNTQSIKQRIIMMTKSNNYSAFRYTLVFPVVAILVMAFATPEILPIQNKELRCPVDAAKLKKGEGAGFGKRLNPATHSETFHTGVDFALPTGSSVYAAAAGKVVKASTSGDYGNLIVIQHDKTLTTYYAHLEKILVKGGDRVDAGQLIGTVGSTGLSTGPHLHFEVLENSKPVDPVPYLDMWVD